MSNQQKNTINRITPTESQWKCESRFSTYNEGNSGRTCRTHL